MIRNEYEYENKGETASNALCEMRMNEFCINYMHRATVPTEFINPNVTTRPKCSISPINNSLIDSTNSSATTSAICNESSYTNNTVNNHAQFYNINQSHGMPINPSSLSQMSNYDQGYQSLNENSLLQASNVSNGFVLTSSPFFPPFVNKNLSINGKEIKSNTRFQSTPTKPDLFNPILTSSSKRVNFHSITDLAKSSDSSEISVLGDKTNTQHYVKELPSLTYSSYTDTSYPNSITSGSKLTSNFNDQLKIMTQSIANYSSVSNKENENDNSKVIEKFFNEEHRKIK